MGGLVTRVDLLTPSHSLSSRIRYQMFVQWGWVRSDNLASDVGVQVCESNIITTIRRL